MNKLLKWLKANKDLLIGLGVMESGWIAAIVINHMWYKKALQINDDWYKTCMNFAQSIENVILEHQKEEKDGE